MFYNSISRGLFSVFLKMVFGGLFVLAMSINVFICQIHLCLRLVVPRAAPRDLLMIHDDRYLHSAFFRV